MIERGNPNTVYSLADKIIFPKHHLPEIKIMIKKLFFIAVILLLCSSCVSRTTYEGGAKTDTEEIIDDKELIWFWDEDF